MHLPHELMDFALILTVAGFVSIACKLLKLPSLFGYVLAGVLLSSETPYFPTPKDSENINIWAQFGIVFFLFHLGLEFSFKKVLSKGPSGFFITVFETLSVMFAGYYAGRWIGWNPPQSLFLGAVLAISSTALIVKMMEDLDSTETRWAQNVFSVVVIEDILSILLLVALSTFAVTQQFSGSALVFPLLKFVFFLVLWFVLGLAIIPVMLRKFSAQLSNELLTVVSVGLCFLMALIAKNVGLSEAMGAFVMGSLLAETGFSRKIHVLVTPFKDVFGGIFFIWVGMQISPSTVASDWISIAVLTLLMMVSKIASNFLGGILAGRSFRDSLLAGTSLAQIGEFSFVVIGLGVSLGVIDRSLFSKVAVVSLVSSVTAPWLLRRILNSNLEKNRFKDSKFYRYVLAYRKYLAQSGGDQKWRDYLKQQALFTLICLVWIVFTVVFIGEWLLKNLPFSGFNQAFVRLLIETVVASPALWFLGVEPFGNKKNRDFWTRAIEYKFYLSFGVILRVGLLVGSVLFMISQSWGLETSVLFAVMGFVLMIFFLSNFLEKIFNRIVAQFPESSANETLQVKDALTESINSPAWDLGLVSIEVKNQSRLVGKTLADLKIRETYNVSLIKVERDQSVLFAPNGGFILYAGDIVSVVGIDSDIEKFREEMNSRTVPKQAFTSNVAGYGLWRIKVELNSKLIGKSVKESQVRDKAGGFIVGVDRKGTRIANPDPDFVFKESDCIWIAGDKRKVIRMLNKSF